MQVQMVHRLLEQITNKMNLNLELYLPAVYRLQKDVDYLETKLNIDGEKKGEE